MTKAATSSTALLERLGAGRPLLAVELRPPRSNLSYGASVDTWIDMNHSVRQLAAQDTFIFLTDNAVGESEEENLQHLTTNLAGEVDPARVVPFLTCKHTLEYCVMYARRASSHGIQAVTVLGGDRSTGAPRCVPHAYELRKVMRERIPELSLGGWANPHRDPIEQAGFVERADFEAEFYLTQIVSHHSIRVVEAFLNEAARRNVKLHGIFGVFLYRSANPKTLERLTPFFPVPAEELTREFESGLSADEICARTIRALRELGVQHMYLSNLGVRRVGTRYRQLLAALEDT